MTFNVKMYMKSKINCKKLITFLKIFLYFQDFRYLLISIEYEIIKLQLFYNLLKFNIKTYLVKIMLEYHFSKNNIIKYECYYLK